MSAAIGSSYGAGKKKTLVLLGKFHRIQSLLSNTIVYFKRKFNSLSYIQIAKSGKFWILKSSN